MMKAQNRVYSSVIGIALTLAALLLSACGGGAPEEKQPPAKPVVGVLLYKADDAYIALVNDALWKELEGQVELVVEDAGHNQLTQDEQLQAMLDRKVSSLVVNLVDAQASADVVDTIKKAGIPAVFFNREPDLATVKTYDRARFVGTTLLDAGKMQGDLIKLLWDAHPEYDRNGDGVVEYIMFQGDPDNPEAMARTEYSVRRARELGLNMRQLGETNVCHWDEGMARDAMNLAWATHGANIELIIANNDAMALGAIASLNAQGWNKEGGAADAFIPVVGVDATPQAREAIRKGVMSATVEQDVEGMAKAIAAMTLNIATGKEFLEGTAYTWGESGVDIRIPYKVYTGAE